ncbi:BspA family leucine-rich repeat surface protein [Spiroplasma endosymbiont of Andrena trimmerana]|uniref:BspA family leucine-rich repeat surface protein n=1 Tax=Spiroplasma endosymbiont of Andrena trimmerana TaxID=3066316 RepID=UPI0030D3859C
MKTLITALSVLIFGTSIGTLNTGLNKTSQKIELLDNKTQQDTIYIDKDGKEQTTNKRDLSNIKTTKITQIGFYKNKQGEIQVVRMPKTIKEVPDKLPSEVTSLNFMFLGASQFNQDLSTWDVSRVTSMLSVFAGATSFNGNISNWDVSNVTDMLSMFNGSLKFDQDLSKWDVSRVTSMLSVFAGATSFNGNISNWDVSNVRSMSGMFTGCFLFNRDLSNWNVSSVEDMVGTFANTLAFNQDLSTWDVSNVLDHTHFAVGSAISNSNKLPKFKNFFINNTI